MEKSIRKEIPVWIIASLPLFYLALTWEQIPQEVPTHFNHLGEADNFGSKMFLFWISLFLPLGIYALLSLVQKIDPKESLHKMGAKYYTLKLFLVAFMSVICFLIIHSAINGSTNMNMFFGVISFLFIFLGNYMQSVPPNYFIGMRTPWTLENPEVWKSTHRLTGRVMIGVGIILLVLAFLLAPNIYFPIFITGVMVVALVPFVFSYLEYKKLKSA